MRHPSIAHEQSRINFTKLIPYTKIVMISAPLRALTIGLYTNRLSNACRWRMMMSLLCRAPLKSRPEGEPPKILADFIFRTLDISFHALHLTSQRSALSALEYALRMWAKSAAHAWRRL